MRYRLLSIAAIVGLAIGWAAVHRLTPAAPEPVVAGWAPTVTRAAPEVAALTPFQVFERPPIPASPQPPRIPRPKKPKAMPASVRAEIEAHKVPMLPAPPPKPLAPPKRDPNVFELAADFWSAALKLAFWPFSLLPQSS